MFLAIEAQGLGPEPWAWVLGPRGCRHAAELGPPRLSGWRRSPSVFREEGLGAVELPQDCPIPILEDMFTFELDMSKSAYETSEHSPSEPSIPSNILHL